MKTESELLEEISYRLPNESKYLAQKIINMVKENKEVFFPEMTKRPKVVSSQHAYDLLKPLLSELEYEEFWIITLKNKLEAQTFKISQGGLTGTVIDTRLILKRCLDNNATSLIVAHNHPSGNKKPSEADILITKKIKDAGALMDITLLDHLIIVKDGYFSFADEGVI